MQCADKRRSVVHENLLDGSTNEENLLMMRLVSSARRTKGATEAATLVPLNYAFLSRFKYVAIF